MAITRSKMLADMAASTGMTFEEAERKFSALPIGVQDSLEAFAQASWRRGALDLKEHVVEYVRTFTPAPDYPADQLTQLLAAHLNKIEVKIFTK